MNLSNKLEGSIIHISMGSNLGDRLLHLKNARRLIGEQIGDLVNMSGVYETTAWGYSSSHHFYNCCLSVMTILEPLSLLDKILAVEESLGRIREGGTYTDRVIDIDLLLYEDIVLDHPRLKIPHPAMAKRRFVLMPLIEIAPDLVHPVSGLTISEMLRRCPDQGEVNLLTSL